MHRLRLVTAAMLLHSAPAGARPSQVQPNAREACRLAVSGAYLKVYDERERLKTFIKAMDAQIAAVDAAVKKAEAERAALEKQARSTSFDVNLAVRRDEVASTARALESQLAQARADRLEAGKNLDLYVASEASLRSAIEPVFAFTRTEDKPDGGYPTDLRFRSECPKFRHLCPLPAKDVEALLKIEPEGVPLEPCQRYAGLSRLR